METLNNIKTDYSVLMSVYKKEKAEYLELSMESMFKQSVPPEEFILICDGPLSDELNIVIKEQERKHKTLRVIRLEKNQGLGHALKIGVLECKNQLIARMDSDDFSKPERCAKEINYLESHPDISIVGSWIEEFSSTPDSVDSVREVPENNQDIIKFAKSRNPFNHPAVMFRRADVIAAGNYRDVRYLQDYYLWVDMLIKGYKGHNLQESLVSMRADGNLFKRRSGREYINIQLNLFRIMLENKFITYPQYIKSCGVRICSGIAPNWVREIVFKTVLRRK